MSISDIVDAEYRLHAADLNGHDMEWTVVNFSYQGLENLSPVLHLEGMAKRLVLDPRMSQQMMTLTHSSIPEDWIGATIHVSPSSREDNGTIQITGVDIAFGRGHSLWSVISQKWVYQFAISLIILAIVAVLLWLLFLTNYAP